MKTIGIFSSQYLEKVLERYFEYLYEDGLSRHHAASICQAVRNKYREGYFGVCIKCGNQIHPLVLTFVPDQPYCRKCEKKLTKRVLAAQGRSRKMDPFACPKKSEEYMLFRKRIR